jgi:2-phosphosulfolactate phosphatase
VIDVALTRERLRPADVTVVIDVLRATSTTVAALAAGYERVTLVADPAGALRLRGPGRVLAGERRYVTPAEFDQGNSPADAACRQGDQLVLSTTNGTPAALAATVVSNTVLLASLLNLRATVARLRAVGRDIQLVCAGAEGEVSLSDVYVAGRIAAELPGPRSDAALLAQATCSRYRSPLDALLAGADAVRLHEAGMRADIALCARESVHDVVAAVTADSHTLSKRLGQVDVQQLAG